METIAETKETLDDVRREVAEAMELSLIFDIENRMIASNLFIAPFPATLKEFITKYSPDLPREQAGMCGCGFFHKASERCGSF